MSDTTMPPGRWASRSLSAPTLDAPHLPTKDRKYSLQTTLPTIESCDDERPEFHLSFGNKRLSRASSSHSIVSLAKSHKSQPSVEIDAPKKGKLTRRRLSSKDKAPLSDLQLAYLAQARAGGGASAAVDTRMSMVSNRTSVFSTAPSSEDSGANSRALPPPPQSLARKPIRPSIMRRTSSCDEVAILRANASAGSGVSALKPRPATCAIYGAPLEEDEYSCDEAEVAVASLIPVSKVFPGRRKSSGASSIFPYTPPATPKQTTFGSLPSARKSSFGGRSSQPISMYGGAYVAPNPNQQDQLSVRLGFRDSQGDVTLLRKQVEDDEGLTVVLQTSSTGEDLDVSLERIMGTDEAGRPCCRWELKLLKKQPQPRPRHAVAASPVTATQTFGNYQISPKLQSSSPPKPSDVSGYVEVLATSPRSSSFAPQQSPLRDDYNYNSDSYQSGSGKSSLDSPSSFSGRDLSKSLSSVNSSFTSLASTLPKPTSSSSSPSVDATPDPSSESSGAATPSFRRPSFDASRLSSPMPHRFGCYFPQVKLDVLRLGGENAPTEKAETEADMEVVKGLLKRRASRWGDMSPGAESIATMEELRSSEGHESEERPLSGLGFDSYDGGPTSHWSDSGASQ